MLKSHRDTFAFTLLLAIPLLFLLLLPQARAIAEYHHFTYAMYLGLLSFAFCFTLVPLMIKLGPAIKLIDEPDTRRKNHAGAIPLTGGLAIYCAFVVVILFNFHFTLQMKAILFSSTLIFVIGLLDDRFELSAAIRLGVQIAASLILVYFGVRMTFVPDWLGGIVTETILTVVWLVGITNSMNFIDGMDGLAGGTCIIYAAFFAVLATILHQWDMMFLTAALAGSCLGFFPYNFRLKGGATIFLGDSGSTFLGFLLASFAMLGTWGRSIIDIAIPILVMALLIFDMTLTTVVRIASGEVKTFFQWIHYTGRDHFHHRLTSLGLGSKAAATVFFCLSVCFGIEALAICYANVTVSVLIVIHSIMILGILGVVLVRKTPSEKHSV